MSNRGVEMKYNEVKEKSYQFALRVIRLVSFLPKNEVCKVIGRQLLRSGTSIGANVEEAQAAYSKSDFANKMNIAQKEARESNYWLRLLKDSKQVKERLLREIIDESDEISKILYSIVRTSKA